MRNNNARRSSLILISVFAVIIAIISYLTPWLNDDLNYMWYCGQDKLLTSLSDIIPSQIEHYYTVNGRFVAHVLVQLYDAILGKFAFAICNGLMYAIFVVCLQIAAGVKPFASFKATLTAVIVSIAFFFTTFIPSCQISYIWGAVVTLTFIRLFLNAKRYTITKTIGLGLFALIAGNFQEAYSIGLSVALIIHWCMNMRQYTLSQWIMIVMYGIGTLVICLSPASQNRADATNTSITVSIFCFISYALALYPLITITLWKTIRNRLKIYSLYKENSLWWNMLIASILFNIIIGVTSNRQLMGVELAAIVLMLKMIKGGAFSRLWLIITSFWLIFEGIQQGNILCQARSIENKMDKQYKITTDGKIYIDGNPCYTLGLLTHITDPFVDPYRSEHEVAAVNARELSRRYPDKAKAVFIPTFLKGKEASHLDNQVITIRPGLYLIIRDKTKPTFFTATRALKIGPFQIRYTPTDISFEKPEFTSRYWDAKVFSDADMSCMTITSIKQN